MRKRPWSGLNWARAESIESKEHGEIMTGFKNTPRQAWVMLLLRLVLGGVFLSSGYAKLAHLDLFYQSAQGYNILTPALTQLYAGALPWLEMLAGLFLLLGLYTRYAAMLTGSLLLSFLIAIGWVLLNGQAADCGCFLGGSQPAPVTWDLWLRDLLMFAGAAAAAFIKPNPWSLDGVLRNKPGYQKASLILVALYLLGVAGIAFSSKIPEKPPAPPVMLPPLLEGTVAPEFTLSDLDGHLVSLKDFRNRKMVLLEFFATWCPHCQHSVPMLKTLHKVYPDQLRVLAINAGDTPDAPPTSIAFRQYYQISYPILEHPPKPLLDAYQVSGFPTIYLVDRSGKIVWNHVGVLDSLAVEQVEQRLSK